MNPVITTSGPASTHSLTPASGEKPSTAKTADKVKEVSTRYFNLCQEYANQPIDEEAFFNRVIEFSAYEAETISTDEEKVQYRDTCVELFKKSTITRTQAPVQTVVAPTHSEGSMDKAETAVEEFTSRTDADAQKLLDAEAEISEINDPKARELRDTIHEALSDRLAPKIPEAAITQTQVALASISERIGKLDFSSCASIQDWTALQQQEDQLVQELAQMRRDTARLYQLNPEGMTHNLEGLTYKGRPAKVETALTPMFEKAGKELGKFQMQRDRQQRAFLAAHYQAREMGGGGDCLFRSMAGVLQQNPDANHLNQRQQIVQHMRKNRTRFQPLVENRIRGDQMARDGIARLEGNDNFEKYLNWMSKQGSWGGEPEIQAFSDMAERPVVMVQEAHTRRGVNTVLPQKIGTEAPVVIKNIGEFHFQAMLKN